MRATPIAAAGVLAIMAVAPANAADIVPPQVSKERPPRPLPPPVAPAYNWTGFYIGGNLGGGWARTDFSGTGSAVFPTIPLTVASTFAGTPNSRGILGGGQVGYNYQFPTHWVLGIEADIDGAGITGSVNTCATATTGGIAGCQTSSSRLNDFGTLRGRVGYAWNNVLLYGTGGFAWGQNSVSHTATCVGAGCPGVTLPFTSTAPSTTSTFAGWAAGAGAEWAFLPNWTLRVEYLHLQFDNVGESYVFTGTAAGFPFTTTSHVSANIGVDVARVGVNYLFNFGSLRSPMAY
jgi:outer membrane immunogenic protein